MERIPGRRGATKITAGLVAAGLTLAACAHEKPIPEGAKAPENYSFEVLIGEVYGNTVHMYSDTKPELTTADQRAQLVINGPTFCPETDVQGPQANEELRHHFCEGNGVYSSYSTTTQERISVIDHSHLEQ